MAGLAIAAPTSLHRRCKLLETRVHQLSHSIRVHVLQQQGVSTPFFTTDVLYGKMLVGLVVGEVVGLVVGLVVGDVVGLVVSGSVGLVVD